MRDAIVRSCERHSAHRVFLFSRSSCTARADTLCLLFRHSDLERFRARSLAVARYSLVSPVAPNRN